MHLSTISLALSFVAATAAQLSAGPIVQQIAPAATSCPPATATASECRTANQAGPWIAQGMIDYKVTDVKEMAAIIALMAFESVDFKYKHNISPGRPGQGTANMQMANYNLAYVKQIPELKDKVAQFKSVDGLSAQDLNYILSLVQPDPYNFGSGPWFLTTQCPGDVRTKLQNNVDEGFQAYMQCVGVSVTPERLAYFQRAKTAFGLK